MSEQELTDRDNEMLALLEWVRKDPFLHLYKGQWADEQSDLITSTELLERFKNRNK